jgi:hypothetical protein
MHVSSITSLEVQAPMSQRVIALTFLRYTCPRREADHVLMAGLCPSAIYSRYSVLSLSFHPANGPIYYEFESANEPF